MFTGHHLQLAEELLEAIWFFNKKGWSPATSTNYSVRTENPDVIIMSRSGVDKSKFNLSDLIMVTSHGEVHPYYQKPGFKASAETEIHVGIYGQFPQANCVLHTHSVVGTVLSQTLIKDKQIVFEGLELLKGLEGNNTHEMREVLPIVPNAQVMAEIVTNMRAVVTPESHGFLIAGHGLYTWGKTIAEAKRHVETFEFLLECDFALRRL